MEHFDLAVIGSGSGNSLVTRDFDDKRVAIIERGTFGGTCLNVGCIPTKMFVYAADQAAAVGDAGRYGVDAALLATRWPDIRDRVFGRIDPLSRAGLDYRATGANTTAITGSARFVAPRRLEVTGRDGSLRMIGADQIVIATGSTPTIPSVIAESGVPFHTSDTVMRLADLPRRVLIVGGGYIACEFAHVFSALGAAVTLAVRGEGLLRHLDAEIATRFTGIVSTRWDLRFGTQVAELSEQPASAGSAGTAYPVSAVLSDGSRHAADVVLVATGRTPASGDLNLAAAGISVHPDGRVAVDRFGRTTSPGVWALGDVASPYQLKHVANHEARVVAHNLAHPQRLRAFNHVAVPSAVFSHPQVASVGATEEELVAAGGDYLVATQRYGDTAYGWAMEDTDGVCKVLADPDTGLLLGCHIVGHQASVIIQPAIQAMALGQRFEDVARRQYWIHPALPEVLENALLGLAPPAD